MTTLIEYFVDSHFSSVESITYVETFKKLRRRRDELEQRQIDRHHISTDR